MPGSGGKHGQYMNTDEEFRKRVCREAKIIVQALSDSLSKLTQNLESVTPAHRIWPFMLIYRDSLLYAASRIQWVLGLVTGERWVQFACEHFGRPRRWYTCDEEAADIDMHLADEACKEAILLSPEAIRLYEK